MTTSKPDSPQHNTSAAKVVLRALEDACAALPPGAAFPSYREWMKRLGASERAVRWALEELQRQGRIAREQGRGTFVLEVEPRQMMGVIGISGAEFSPQAHAYWNPFLEGVRRIANSNDIEVLLLSYSSEVNWGKMDGMIIHRTNLSYSTEVLRSLPAGMPAIAALVAVPDMPSVLVDEYQGCRAVMQHLIGLGHRHIAYMYDCLSKLRLMAYRDALEEAGIDANEEWIYALEPADQTYASLGHEKMGDWLQANWQSLGCTALVAQNDDTAIGAIRAFREAGIAVPEQVSVTGFDGTEVGQYFSPALTTVNVPLQEIGAAAMELLLRQIRGEEVPVASTVLPTTLMPRDSTQSPLAAQDETSVENKLAQSAIA